MRRSIPQNQSTTGSGTQARMHSRTASSSSLGSSKSTSRGSTPSSQANRVSSAKRKPSTQDATHSRKRPRPDQANMTPSARQDRSSSLPMLGEEGENDESYSRDREDEDMAPRDDTHPDNIQSQGSNLNVDTTSTSNGKAKKSGPFINLGRFIIRAVVAFQDLYSIFNEGLIRINANWPTNPDQQFDDTDLEQFQIPAESETSGFNRDIDASERGQYYRWFCQIYRADPKLTMRIIASDSDEYTELIGELVTGAGYARSTDLHAVRDLLPSWFPNIQSVAKCSRGFFNHHTAMLLRPANIDIKDSASMKRFEQDESLSFPPAAELPRFLYSGTPEIVVDVNHPTSTILRGLYHLASYCRIYQSDKGAIKIFTLDGKGDLDTLSDTADEQTLSKRSLGSTTSVGKSCGISGPTAHTIAYSGCLLRAALSSTEKLMDSDDPSSAYSYSTLYREIIDTLEPGDSPSTGEAIEAIMNWWKKHAYPTKKKDLPTPPPRLSARERMLIETQTARGSQVHAPSTTAATEEPSPQDSLPVSSESTSGRAQSEPIEGE